MVSRSLRLVAFVLTLSLVTAAKVDASTIDFESLPDSTVVTTQFAGLTFVNARVLTAGISLNELEFPPHSGTNVIVDDGGAVRIDFGSPMTSFSGFFTHLSTLTLSAFNASNTLLGSVSSVYSSNLALSGDPGSAPNEFLQVAFANMAYVRIAAAPSGGSFTADDITVRSAVAEVPEPGTMSLVLIGILALGRRQRRALGDRTRRVQ